VALGVGEGLVVVALGVGEGLVVVALGVGEGEAGCALRLNATPTVIGPGRSLFGSNCNGWFSGLLSPQLFSVVTTKGVS
jgi:hypothetical protein